MMSFFPFAWLFCVLFCGCFCCNRIGLAKIDVWAYRDSDRHVTKLHSVNLLNLDDFKIIEVVNASVSVLCKSSVKNLRRLESLSLNLLGIEDIEIGAFESLPRLRKLALSLNKLSVIREGIFNHLNIEKLHLSSNNISLIDTHAFDSMPNLAYVHLDRNRIKFIDPEWFLNSPNLRSVNLMFNQIRKIPERAFRNIVPIHYDIVQIHLQNNDLEEINKRAIGSPKKYLVLRLEHNRIANLPLETFRSLSGLNGIVLNSNHIRCLSDDVLLGLENSSVSLHLLDNPIECECMKKFDRTSQNLMDYHTFYYNTTLDCYFPSPAKYKHYF